MVWGWGHRRSCRRGCTGGPGSAGGIGGRGRVAALGGCTGQCVGWHRSVRVGRHRSVRVGRHRSVRVGRHGQCAGGTGHALVMHWSCMDAAPVQCVSCTSQCVVAPGRVVGGTGHAWGLHRSVRGVPDQCEGMGLSVTGGRGRGLHRWSGGARWGVPEAEARGRWSGGGCRLKADACRRGILAADIRLQVPGGGFPAADARSRMPAEGQCRLKADARLQMTVEGGCRRAMRSSPQ